jgi:thiosulfate/3-mercaptopyruvate sulfurtransferase
LEPWEKVIVDVENFSAEVHGKMECSICHQGNQSPEKEIAHEGLIPYPSQDASICQTCHPDITTAYQTSLHATQGGYWTQINARSEPDNAEKHAALEEMFGNHCASCHTACGDCHVSQPRSVGGGLIDGHMFKATPSLTRNCTACHGSRVGNEYLGKNEGIKADVHFRQGRMKCSDCHTGVELHAVGQETPATHRYEGAQSPVCIDCHETVKSDNLDMHQMHGDKLACQVCHSESYSSCDGCHVAVSEETGNAFFATEGTYQTFFIGQNTRQDENRPYEYVPVRHIPVAPTSYEFYGENLLSNFDALPTWAYATPHNIQRNTPQNESCEACHGNADIFLTADKVKPEELTANQGVIVDSPPPALGEMTSGDSDGEESESAFSFFLPESHAGLPFCVKCHSQPVEDIPELPGNHVDYSDAECLNCHQMPQPTETEEPGSS